MKKSVWLSATVLTLLGAPAFASDGGAISDCHAADMPKSVYDACINRSRSNEDGGAQESEDRGLSSNEPEREAGLAETAGDDADQDGAGQRDDENRDGTDNDHGTAQYDDGTAGNNSDEDSAGQRDDEYRDGNENDHDTVRGDRDGSGEAGDNDVDRESQDRDTNNWNGGSTTEDQSDSADEPYDRSGASPDEPAQGDEDDGGDDGYSGDDGSNA